MLVDEIKANRGRMMSLDAELKIMAADMKFEYVEVVGKGCEGWINLFFGEHIVALIRNVWLADQIKSVTAKRGSG